MSSSQPIVCHQCWESEGSWTSCCPHVQTIIDRLNEVRADQDAVLTKYRLDRMCNHHHPDSWADACSGCQSELLDRLEAAWVLIANSYGGTGFRASGDWEQAAERWRDRYHEILPEPPQEEE